MKGFKRNWLGFGLAAVLLMAPLGAKAAGDSDTAEIEFWQSVKESAVPAELEAYLEAYPDGKFAPLARIRLDRLKNGPGDERQDAQPDRIDGTTGRTAGATATAPTFANAVTKVVTVTLGANPRDKSKGRLGITIGGIWDGFRKAFGLGKTSGLLVRKVDPDAAAARSGIVPGHIVKSMDGHPVSDVRSFVNTVSDHRPGDTVTLEIVELASTPEALVERLRHLAEIERNKDAAVALGNMYWLGQLVEKSKEKAVLYYRIAAESGHPGAMLDLGQLYRRGEALPKDDAKAFEWTLAAALNGEARAYRQVAIDYMAGSGTKQDLEEALRWFRKSAQAGNAGSMLQLAQYVAKGIHTKRDAALAVDWTLQALKASDEDIVGENANNLKDWGADYYRELQQRLKAEGHYSVRADGVFGPATKNAMRSYWRAHRDTGSGPELTAAKEEGSSGGGHETPAPGNSSSSPSSAGLNELDLKGLGDLKSLD